MRLDPAIDFKLVPEGVRLDIIVPQSASYQKAGGMAASVQPTTIFV